MCQIFITHTHARTHIRIHTHAHTRTHTRTHTHTIESQQESQPTSSSSNPASILSHSRLLQRSVCQRMSRSTLLQTQTSNTFFIFLLFLRGKCVTWNLLKSSKLQLDCYRLQERTKSETKKFVDSTTNLCSNRNISCQMSLISSFVIVLSLFQSVCLFVGRSVCLQLENVRALKIRNCLVLSD